MKTRILIPASDLIIEHGSHWKDIQYICAFNLYEGIRLGYIILPVEMKDKIDLTKIDVHGDFTFEEITDKHPINFDKEYYVIGFDCGHYGDKPDFEAWKKYLEKDENIDTKTKKFLFEIMKTQNIEGEVRSLDYVIEQCRYVIDQIK